MGRRLSYKKLTREEILERAPKIKIKCDQCGKHFEMVEWVLKSKIKHKNQKKFYCSKECAKISISISLKKDENENRFKICRNCGNWYFTNYRTCLKNNNRKIKRCRNCVTVDQKKRAAAKRNSKKRIVKLGYKDGKLPSKRLKKSKFCKVCGIKLNTETRTHKNLQHSVCDICMYIRKQSYKTITLCGDSAVDNAAILIMAVRKIHYDTKTKGRKEWQKITIENLKSIENLAETMFPKIAEGSSG